MDVRIHVAQKATAVERIAASCPQPKFLHQLAVLEKPDGPSGFTLDWSHVVAGTGPLMFCFLARLAYRVIMVSMAKQQSDKPDRAPRRRGPPPTGVGLLIGVRIQPDDLQLLDAWRGDQPDEPGRPEAIRRLVEFALKEKGKR
jgi:hypothetical protein